MFSQDMSERQPAAVLVLGIYILILTQHKVKVTPLPLKCGESGWTWLTTWNGITNRETKWNTRKSHPKTEQMVLDIEENTLLYEMYPPAI